MFEDVIGVFGAVGEQAFSGHDDERNARSDRRVDTGAGADLVDDLDVGLFALVAVRTFGIAFREDQFVEEFRIL